MPSRTIWWTFHTRFQLHVLGEMDENDDDLAEEEDDDDDEDEDDEVFLQDEQAEAGGGDGPEKQDGDVDELTAAMGGVKV